MMTAAPDLVLRDIHQPLAPSWWPPAAGWWWLAAGLLAIGLLLVLWWLRRARRLRRWRGVFDAALAAAADDAGRLAAISALLRRAARRQRADADRLCGEAWLAFLDAGHPAEPFLRGPGRVLLDGAFRPTLEDIDMPALQTLARARFMALMRGRRR